MKPGNRKKLEQDIIYRFTDAMDPTGRNTQVYKEFLSTMDDNAFEKFLIKFFETDGMNIVIRRRPLESVTMEHIEEAAEKLGVKLRGYMAMPYLNGDTEDPAVSIEEVLFSAPPTRRLMQTVMSKNSTSTSIDKVNPETGQISDSDKHARLTDVETFSYTATNQDEAAIEMSGLRSDQPQAFSQAMKQIYTTGELDLDLIDTEGEIGVALQTLNMFMLAAGYGTTLVGDNPYLLPITVKGKEDLQKIKRKE